MKLIKILIQIIGVLVFMALMVLAGIFTMQMIGNIIDYAITKNEVVECNTLEEYSRVYKPHFYLTPWQKEMCDRHEIIINAPVKPPYESK